MRWVASQLLRPRRAWRQRSLSRISRRAAASEMLATGTGGGVVAWPKAAEASDTVDARKSANAANDSLLSVIAIFLRFSAREFDADRGQAGCGQLRAVHFPNEFVLVNGRVGGGELDLLAVGGDFGGIDDPARAVLTPVAVAEAA